MKRPGRPGQYCHVCQAGLCTSEVSVLSTFDGASHKAMTGAPDPEYLCCMASKPASHSCNTYCKCSRRRSQPGCLHKTPQGCQAAQQRAVCASGQASGDAAMPAGRRVPQLRQDKREQLCRAEAAHDGDPETCSHRQPSVGRRAAQRLERRVS